MAIQLRGILRVPDTEAATGYSRASIYRLEKLGQFPSRVKLGTGQGGAVGWRASDVQAWIDARMDGRAWTNSMAPDSATSHPVSRGTQGGAA